MIQPRPVTIVIPATKTSTAAKRILFRASLCIAMFGSVIVSAILFLQGGLALGHLRYFVDIGQHPLHITSTFVLIFGLLSILTFIILTIGLIKVNRTFAIIAAGLLAICSVGLLIFSIWSFATLASEKLSQSINNDLIQELNQTQYNNTAGHVVVENTVKMARLEKQHQCCGLVDAVEEYRSRQPTTFGSSSSSSGSTRGRPGGPPKGSSPSILLPISCCIEIYRFNESSCLDLYGNASEPSRRYYNEGCSTIIFQDKVPRIQQQGFTTMVAATLAVISCIALAAVIRLLGEGYQVVPLRTAT
jgi:ABC-type multidrug transport system fused ATPase/permease subunit